MYENIYNIGNYQIIYLLGVSHNLGRSIFGNRASDGIYVKKRRPFNCFKSA